MKQTSAQPRPRSRRARPIHPTERGGRWGLPGLVLNLILLECGRSPILRERGRLPARSSVFDLVDEVWDAGDELVVKDKGAEDHIPLSDIMNISYSMFTNPQRVTLMLRRPSQFGQEISFVPPARVYPFWRSPIVDELIQRVDATRRR